LINLEKALIITNSSPSLCDSGHVLHWRPEHLTSIHEGDLTLDAAVAHHASYWPSYGFG
jgi:hypothetical protein